MAILNFCEYMLYTTTIFYIIFLIMAFVMEIRDKKHNKYD